MKHTRIVLLTIISVIINFNSFGQTGTIEDCLLSADTLFSHKQYKPAVREYQRYLFYSGKEDSEVLLKIAKGLYNLGEYDLSLKYYDKIFYLSDNPDIQFECRIKEIIFYLKENKYNNALRVLFSLDDSFSQSHSKEMDFLFAVTYFGLEDFEQSEDYFIKITEGDSVSTAGIKELFSDKRKLYKPDPHKIYLLSLFIPGLGQVISSEYKNGLNSFLLVEGIGVLAVFVAIKYSFIDAVLTVVPWYQRYLSGGAKHAEDYAVQKIKKNRNQIYLEILRVLEPYKDELSIN